MNDGIALELIKQRTAERREEARNAGLVRMLRKAKRQRESEHALVGQPIPDYVDGTFRPADDLIGDKHEKTAR